MSEYTDELARAIERQEAQRKARKYELRARRLLVAAGWDATAEQLRAANNELSVADRIETEQLEAAIARALELQSDETVRGRRLRPEEIVMAKPTVDTSTRDKIREYILERRRRTPDLKAAAVHAEVAEKFGVDSTLGNFYVTYWGKVSKQLKKNGAKPPAAAAKTDAPSPATADAPPPAAKTETEAATKAAAAASTKTAEQKPIASAVGELPCFSLVPFAGRVRVQLDIVVDVAGAGLLANQIGAALHTIGRGRP